MSPIDNARLLVFGTRSPRARSEVGADGHRFSTLAEQSLTSGHAYKMIVADEEDRRTSEQNNKIWAAAGRDEQRRMNIARPPLLPRISGKPSSSMHGA